MSSWVASWSLLTAITALKQGRLSPREYQYDLNAHERQQGDFDCYITRTEEQHTHSTGLLSGIPLAVKDNIDVAGVPTTAATPKLRGHVPIRSADVWHRLSKAGAGLSGKTTLHELAYGITGIGSGTPTARNPHNPHYLAGGSSSGSAAGVAAGLVPAALGTDTGGSVRIPAALCGIVGFRPTTGRYPHRGVIRISPSRDTIGLMARDVDDIILLDKLIMGETYPHTPFAAPVKALRLAVPQPSWHRLDDEVARITSRALNILECAGCILVETGATIHAGPEEEWLDVAMNIPLAETPGAIEAYLQESKCNAGFDEIINGIAAPDVRAILMPLLEKRVLPAEYQALITKQHNLRCAALLARQKYYADAVIMPATILTAPPADVGEEVKVKGNTMSTFQAYIRNTAPSTILGVPSVTIPAGFTADGLPVGLQMDGAPGDDTQLLMHARYCMQLLHPVMTKQ